MPQPSGQLALASGNSSEYFWYAQGTNGIWDAKNSVLLTKTGPAGMATEGGAQVALGDGATSYALASAIIVAAPFTILWKCRTNASAGNNSMAWGNGAASDCLAWMDRSGNCDVRLARSGGYDGFSFANSSPTTMATFAISMAANGAYVVYKNGSQVASASMASAPYSLKLSELLDGYTGTSFGLKGALEFVNIVPSVLTSGEVAARYSDPYSVLDAGASAATAISATTANTVGSLSSNPVPRTAIAATLANALGAVASFSGSSSTTISATTASAVGTVSSTGSTANGTFTSEILRDYGGTVLASVTLNYVRFYNDTTGALVLSKTGVSTNASGIVTFSDAALVAGQTYRVDWETAAGSRRMPRKAAT